MIFGGDFIFLGLGFFSQCYVFYRILLAFQME